MSQRSTKPVALSIGVLATGRERTLCAGLESLFRQTVFERLGTHESCEVLLLVHGHADPMAAAARELVARQQRDHPWAVAFTARTIEIEPCPRNVGWNRFVHEFSAVEARYLVTMHGDVLLHHRDAIFSLAMTLASRRRLHAASGRRWADVLFKERRTFWERLAVSAPPASDDADVRLHGELAAFRASIARKLYLPKELGVGADVFLTSVLRTDFLLREPDRTRLALLPDAAHICPTAANPREALHARKRRMVGQAASLVLLDYLRGRPWRERLDLATTLRRHEAADGEWLKKLIAARVLTGRLLLNLLGACVRGVRPPTVRQLVRVPEACVGFLLNIVACLGAHRLLRARAVKLFSAAPGPNVTSAPALGAK
jgi:hypothetical protein